MRTSRNVETAGAKAPTTATTTAMDEDADKDKDYEHGQTMEDADDTVKPHDVEDNVITFVCGVRPGVTRWSPTTTARCAKKAPLHVFPSDRLFGSTHAKLEEMFHTGNKWAALFPVELQDKNHWWLSFGTSRGSGRKGAAKFRVSGTKVRREWWSLMLVEPLDELSVAYASAKKTKKDVARLFPRPRLPAPMAY